MIPGLMVILMIAVIDWIAVSKGWRKVEVICKPAVMVSLVVLLVGVGGFGPGSLLWFGLGLLFSLAGDVFLLFSDRWFIPGLVSFLLAHIMYIIGFNTPPPEVSTLWAIGTAIVLALCAARILQRITASLAARGLKKLIWPVVIYGVVITLMLLSAMLTLYRMEWKSWASLLVAVGAVLFYLSDLVLAWNKFVAPIKNGRVINMVSYHLGQMALILGVLIQFMP